MKKNYLWMLTAILTLSGMNDVMAQEADPAIMKYVSWLDTIFTKNTIDKDYLPVEWKGEGFHAGMLAMQGSLVAGRFDREYEIPEYVDIYVRLKDCYGDVLSEQHGDANGILAWGYYQDFDAIGISMQCFVERGGDYVFERAVPWLGFERITELTLKDEPSARLQNLAQMNTGSDLNGMVLFNTGYPYDRNRLTGKERAAYTLRYLAPNSKDTVEIAKGEQTLTFDNSLRPRLAAIDTLSVKCEKPALGRYFFNVETNWENDVLGDMSRRSTTFQVIDTLRAVIALDKEQYQMGTDRQLLANVTLNCGYPFIHATAPDEQPTVRLRYRIVGNGKELFSDSLKIVDPKLADEPLQYSGQLAMSLDKVTAAHFEEDNQMTLYVEVGVTYNGALQHIAKFHPLLLKSEAEGIDDVPSTKHHTPSLFDLQGRRVGSMPTRGMYKKKKKKIIIKKVL